MSIYFNTVTLEYPRHNGDLELMGWKAGEPLPNNWVEVEYTENPEITEKQKLVSLLPIQDTNGKWKMQWSIENLTEEEYQKNQNIKKLLFKNN